MGGAADAVAGWKGLKAFLLSFSLSLFIYETEREQREEQRERDKQIPH